MHENALYQMYLKRCLIPAMAAFRQKVYRLKLWRRPCSSCGADDSETYHADLSKPAACLWICRKCRGQLVLYTEYKSTEQKLKELKAKFKTFEEWKHDHHTRNVKS